MAIIDKTFLDYDGLTSYHTKISQKISNIPKRIYFGTCASIATAQNKEVAISNDQAFNLTEGVIVGIKFTNTNTYNSTVADPCTLNINSTGAKSIYYNDGVPTGTDPKIFGYAGRYIFYIYDGTYWVWQSYGYDDGKTPSIENSTLVFE